MKTLTTLINCILLVGLWQIVLAQNSIQPSKLVAIPGVSIKALQSSLKDFDKIRDLKTSQKQMKNYSIEITSDTKFYYVHFYPRHSLRHANTFGGENEYGREVKYTVSRKNGRIVKRSYFE